MLSVKWVKNVEYYLDQSSPDYYLQGGEPPGGWWGRGAEELGLVGAVTREQLEPLFAGYSPQGVPLVQNAGAKDRQSAWDLTFSAPKSLSVIWSQADPLTRRRIEELHDAAVRDALDYLQGVAAWTRRGKGGKRVEPAGLVVATFQHGASRELDPQLHTHALVLNAATRADGTTGTILSKPLYRHKLAAGALYRASLDCRLQDEFGFATERDDRSFHVRGVPQGLCETHSKRRRQIKALLKTRGVHSAKAAAVATLATRRAKGTSPPRSELLEVWREVNPEHGFTQGSVASLFGRAAERDVPEALADALRVGLAKLLHAQAYFAEKDLVQATAVEAQGRGVPAHEILRGVRGLLASGEFVSLGVREHERLYTTPAMLAVEKRLLRSVHAGRMVASHVLPRKPVRALLDRRLPLGPSLTQDERRRNEEQRAAVERLTVEPGRIQVVEGMAGTGKTHMLGVCREAWRERGYRVEGMALAGIAARNLEKGSGIQSETLALRLRQLDAGGEFARHHRRQLGRLVRGKSTHAFRRPFRLDARTVVVLDEAGMVATEQLERLVAHVERAGAKLVLVGDRRQLQPIEAGGPLPAVAKRVGVARLDHIVRQEPDPRDDFPEWAREAVRLFAAGKAADALALFQERGQVFVGEDRGEAMERLVLDWSRSAPTDPAGHVVLAPTNQEVDRLNGLCQAARVAGLATPPRSIDVGGTRLMEGDRVLFGTKSRILGVENGDRGSLVRVDPRRQVVTVELDRADPTRPPRVVQVPLPEYRDVRLGYAMTVHKAQGGTFARSYVLAGGAMQDLHLSYVEASRATDFTRFYTDKHEAGMRLGQLAEQMSKARVKDLAHDVLAGLGGKAADKPETGSPGAPKPKPTTPTPTTTPPAAPTKPRAGAAALGPGAQRRSHPGRTTPTGSGTAANADPLARPLPKAAAPLPSFRAAAGGAPTLGKPAPASRPSAPTKTTPRLPRLAHLAGRLLTAPEYLRAAIRRYGLLPGGIVVEGHAEAPLTIRSLASDPQRPQRLVVNGGCFFDTGLEPEEIACLLDDLDGAGNDANFGAVSQDDVVGMAPDRVVAHQFLAADNTLGSFVYGYDSRFEPAGAGPAGYVNPFRVAAAAAARGDPRHLRRVAENTAAEVVPQVFCCFSGLKLELHGTSLAPVRSELTVAFGAKRSQDRLEDDPRAAAGRFPLEHAAAQHLAERFVDYAAEHDTACRVALIAETVQLVRLARASGAELDLDAEAFCPTPKRRRFPSPIPRYTERSAEFERLATETAVALRRHVERRLSSAGMDLHAACVGWWYAHRAGEPTLAAFFKRSLLGAPPDVRDATLPGFDRSVLERTPHDVLVSARLDAALRHPYGSARRLRPLDQAIAACRPAVRGPGSDPATICSFADASALRDASYNPTPDLERVVTAPEFAGFGGCLLPYLTLTNIAHHRLFPELAHGDDEALRQATGRIAAELGFDRLDRRALGYFAGLRHGVPPLAALDVLEKLRLWRCRQEDFAAVVKEYKPGNTLELKARLALRKLLGLPPEQLQLKFLHDASPWRLSYPLLMAAPPSSQAMLLRPLEDRLRVGAGRASLAWWEAYRRGSDGLAKPVLFAQELLCRRKTLDELLAAMGQQKLKHPQAGLFALDLDASLRR